MAHVTAQYVLISSRIRVYGNFFPALRSGSYHRALRSLSSAWTSTTSRLRSAGYRPRRCRHIHNRNISSRAAPCCPSDLLNCYTCTHTRKRERRRPFRSSATSNPSEDPIIISNLRSRQGLATRLCQWPRDGHRHGHLRILWSPLSPPSPRTPQHYRTPLFLLRSCLLCRPPHLGSV